MTSARDYLQIASHYEQAIGVGDVASLVSQYRGLVQRIEVQMKNFALIPFGKPLVSRPISGPANPWAGLMRAR